tara:strand:+ start:809 stop:1624 length:816 start_codon:yes stop_codon:yes gene_type:complete
MSKSNNDDLFKQFYNEGVISFENLFTEEELKDLSSDFEGIKKENFSVKFGEENFEYLSSKLLNYLKKKNIYHFFEKYFGEKCVCCVAQYTQKKFENNLFSDQKLTDEGSETAFHHDNAGHRLKFNILLNDIDKNANGLDYAVKSNFPSRIDKFIVKLLNLFGYFKNFEREFLRYIKRKFIDRKIYNFIEEEKIYKKYVVKNIYGKRGLAYIFDTNGFHRRSIPDKNLIGERKLLTYFFISKKKFDYLSFQENKRKYNNSNHTDKNQISLNT